MTFNVSIKAVLVFILLISLINMISAVAVPITSNAITTTSDGYEVIKQNFTDLNLSDGTLRIFETTSTFSINKTNTTDDSTLVKRDGHCEHSSFVSKTTAGSPKWNDCSFIALHARQNPRTFVIPKPSGWHQGYARLYAYGTCQFGARGRVLDALMGNDDVADLMADSLRMFGHGFHDAHKVGAEGDLGCRTARGGNGLTAATWAIFHA